MRVRAIGENRGMVLYRGERWRRRCTRLIIKALQLSNHSILAAGSPPWLELGALTKSRRILLQKKDLHSYGKPFAPRPGFRQDNIACRGCRGGVGGRAPQSGKGRFEGSGRGSA